MFTRLGARTLLVTTLALIVSVIGASASAHPSMATNSCNHPGWGVPSSINQLPDEQFRAYLLKQPEGAFLALTMGHRAKPVFVSCTGPGYPLYYGAPFHS